MSTHTKQTDTDDTHIEQLLQQSRESTDPDAALEYSQRAADVSPNDPDVQRHLQSLLFGKLKSDAYLNFLAQTAEHYVVSFRGSRPVVVPKARAALDDDPDRARTEGERAFALLRWVLLGLIPAGIGALVLSPLVIGRAVGVLGKAGGSVHEKRLAWVTIGVATVLGLLGMIFSLALVLHLLD